ncbi:MAG: hypothetical protein ACEPOZ_14750 [Marinifilaceae bacterium]|jgi:hypothetical protein
MRKFKDLSANEKMMISFVIVLILGIALNWGRVVDGFKKGLKPYMEQSVQE